MLRNGWAVGFFGYDVRLEGRTVRASASVFSYFSAFVRLYGYMSV